MKLGSKRFHLGTFCCSWVQTEVFIVFSSLCSAGFAFFPPQGTSLRPYHIFSCLFFVTLWGVFLFLLGRFFSQSLFFPRLLGFVLTPPHPNSPPHPAPPHTTPHHTTSLADVSKLTGKHVGFGKMVEGEEVRCYEVYHMIPHDTT